MSTSGTVFVEDSAENDANADGFAVDDVEEAGCDIPPLPTGTTGSKGDVGWGMEEEEGDEVVRSS